MDPSLMKAEDILVGIDSIIAPVRAATNDAEIGSADNLWRVCFVPRQVLALSSQWIICSVRNCCCIVAV